jgi:protease I
MASFLYKGLFICILILCLIGCQKNEIKNYGGDLNMSNIILVVAQNGFQEKELSDTKDALQKAGFKCDIAAKNMSWAVGKEGMKIMPDLTIGDAIESLAMYAGVAFIGGPGAASYFEDKEALELAKKSYSSGKLTAAICIAPVILANAGILEGRKATVWDIDGKQSSYFEDLDIMYTGQDVTVDGKIITGNGPMAAKKFGEEIAKLLEE